MWAENDLSSDMSHESSASDSGGTQKKRKVAGRRQAGHGGTTTSSENEDGSPRKKATKKTRSSRDGRRKRKRDSKDMDTSDCGSDIENSAKRRKKQKADDGRDEDENELKSKHFSSTSKGLMTKFGGRSKSTEPDSRSETSSSRSDINSEEESKPTQSRTNSRKSIISPQPKKRAHARSRSPLASLDDKTFGGAYVYRAVRQERVALGWSQAPCGSCPVFDFCKEGGPVGPSECEYYGEWLKRPAITMDS
jgi:DNA-directed RNA polymerase III subunit RPC6